MGDMPIRERHISITLTVRLARFTRFLTREIFLGEGFLNFLKASSNLTILYH